MVTETIELEGSAADCEVHDGIGVWDGIAPADIWKDLLVGTRTADRARSMSKSAVLYLSVLSAAEAYRETHRSNGESALDAKLSIVNCDDILGSSRIAGEVEASCAPDARSTIARCCHRCDVRVFSRDSHDEIGAICASTGELEGEEGVDASDEGSWQCLEEYYCEGFRRRRGDRIEVPPRS